MKKFYFLLLFAVTILNPALAQRSGLFMGVQLGIQNSWIFNKNDFDAGGVLDFKATFKPSFGLNVGYNLSKNLGFQSGIIFSQQGQKYITDGNSLADYKTDLNYLKFPLLLKWNSDPEKIVSFLLHAGVQICLLQSANSSRTGGFGYYSPNLTDVKDLYSSSPFELVLGFGAMVNLGKLNISALLRPEYSLTDIEKVDLKSSSRDIARNFVFSIPQLSLNYSLND
ncbi:MAG: porin family protein [Saprospiraceae bacterium]|nr:PorT family protein [Candidatus Vicinibacter proximus]